MNSVAYNGQFLDLPHRLTTDELVKAYFTDRAMLNRIETEDAERIIRFRQHDAHVQRWRAFEATCE